MGLVSGAEPVLNLNLVLGALAREFGASAGSAVLEAASPISAGGSASPVGRGRCACLEAFIASSAAESAARCS